ncbi:type II toxin-antitoxin system HicA family toxin [Candidatus Peregrinibacteria bacterium]|nr:type II toxin-antitoxin system HicA family toxin [Candidatus Peregrinibacteria bacterium]MBI3815919.1 type II toxin-antitoxin system HicA family toxin [Candidatus Peregrinibacteria bacterium]
MGKLRRTTGKALVRFLRRQGFALRRITGSHHIMGKGEKHTSVPVHGNDTLKLGTLTGILSDIEMSNEEFERLWNT